MTDKSTTRKSANTRRRRKHEDALALGPLGAAETDAAEEAASERADERFAAWVRAERAAGRDPYQAHLLPAPKD